jgi:hypothetical protein
MVDDDYTDKEDDVVDEEAIVFNNRDKDDDDDNKGDDSSDDDDHGGDDYIEVVATTEKKKRKKGKLSMSMKRHRSKGTTNAPINHDSVMLSGEGDADFEGDADAEDSDDDIDLFEEKRYEKTKAVNWIKHHENGQLGRDIRAIPFTGPAEFFQPNLSDDKVKGMMDAHGDIRFHKLFEWMLPTFEGVSFYEFLSARMRNYMLHSIKDKG